MRPGVCFALRTSRLEPVIYTQLVAAEDLNEACQGLREWTGTYISNLKDYYSSHPAFYTSFCSGVMRGTSGCL